MRSDPPTIAWARASPAGRRLPVCGLLLALSTVWLFVGDRDYFYSHVLHDVNSGKNMSLAANLSAQHGFLFHTKHRRQNGTVGYQLYNRFPLGAFVLIKLAILPFQGDFSAQIVGARALMLAFFCGAAVFAYLGLARLANSRAVALGAVLLAFSSYHLLDYADAVSNEMSVDLFAVMLVFHGMVLFEVEGGRRRFWELAARVCLALLLGWHVYGLLLPFLAFGAVRAAVAWRKADGAARERRAGSRRLLGRYAVLGALALLFGAGMLGWNLAREYAALGGKRPLAELPSARSMLTRTGLRETSYARREEMLPLPTLLKWQFHRVGAASLPVALSGGIDMEEFTWRESGSSWLFWAGLAATLGVLASLGFFRGPRAPPFALALAGFGWTFLVPQHMGYQSHEYETMFHVGVPLCLFAALLLVVRHFWRPAPVVGAAAAAVIFAVSSVAMGLAHRDPVEARAERALLTEFDAIAGTIRGSSIWVPVRRAALLRFVRERRVMNFLVAGSFVHYADRLDGADPAAIGALDFVLAFERYDIPSLLTPHHRFVFLYRAGADAAAVLAAMREARREEHRRLQALTPVVRAPWAVHVLPGPRAGWEQETRLPRRGVAEIVLFKTPCGSGDTRGIFQFGFLPAAGQVPWGRTVDLERGDFLFPDYGVRRDGKCELRVPLPAWHVGQVSVRRVPTADGAVSWSVAFRLDLERLRNELRSLRTATPAAQGEFNLYLHDGVLRYVRRPCAAADVRRRFYLHVAPATVSALPWARRRGGFDNLDFDFGEHGAMLDGACVAMVKLPDYGLARVYTGQFDSDAGAETWRVELAADALAAGG